MYVCRREGWWDVGGRREEVGGGRWEVGGQETEERVNWIRVVREELWESQGLPASCRENP
jgi:hypothetical protein